MVAGIEGNSRMCELLIEFGTDLEKKDEMGNTVLFYAVMKEKREIVEKLIKKGANVNTKNKYEMTCLHIAVEKGNREICEILLKN